MAKPRPRKLKVFQAQLGFVDSVVAAPNQAEALEAWGTHQNLFASGDAKLTQDPAAEKAALAHPGTPLQRPVGTKDPFELQPKGAPAKNGRPRAKPDRSRLDAAEAALRKLEKSWKNQAEDLRRQQEELDERRAAAEEAHAAALEAAKSEAAAARKAYRAASR